MSSIISAYCLETLIHSYVAYTKEDVISLMRILHQRLKRRQWVIAKAATFSLDIFHWSGRWLLWEKQHLKLETSKGTQSGLKLCSKLGAGPWPSCSDSVCYEDSGLGCSYLRPPVYKRILCFFWVLVMGQTLLFDS